MTRLFVTTFAPALLALLTAFALGGAAVAQDGPLSRNLPGVDSTMVAQYDEEDCLDNRQIQQAINAGEILPLAEVLANAGIRQRPLSVKVCDVGGEPHYVVNTIDSYGESERIVLNAEAGY